MTAGSIRNIGVYYTRKRQFIHNYSPEPLKIRNLKNESRNDQRTAEKGYPIIQIRPAQKTRESRWMLSLRFKWLFSYRT